MNAALEKILIQFTGKVSFEEVSTAQLKQLTESHPYFSAGHLMLAARLKAEGAPEFAAQLQRTAIGFPNTLWLHHLLQDEADVPLPVSTGTTAPLLERVIREEQEMQASQMQYSATIPGQDDTMIVADADEDQYAASTTEEALQQAEDEEKQKEVIASVLEDQLAEFKKPVTADTELKIETEPYYTVDYFASQGIKVDLTQPQDKLGSQLRKFTDWLKQMKSVKTEASDLGTDPEVENMIQGIAKTSNETKEIVTETMADVLVKQGKTDKAIQLYIKLSFLNPDKSAYFAAKIEQLKGI